MLRGRRVLTLSVLLSLPICLALLIQRYAVSHDPQKVEMAILFAIFPQALTPLTTLVFGSGMVQDELDDQTLTYLLIRPIPRWLIYVVKLVATVAVSAVFINFFSVLCLAVIYKFDFSDPALGLVRIARLAILQTLAIAAYCSLFGLLSILFRRTLVLGVLYLISFEGVLANIDFVARKLTVMYYFRLLSINWLNQKAGDWNIDLKTAPDTETCLWNLVWVAVGFTAIAAAYFDWREFRVKTPEGN
jgi:ABC-2 type transport system permease protein